MGESPVERGLARAHLHALARGNSLQFPPVVGIIRFLPPFKPSPKLLNSIEDARVSNMSAFETQKSVRLDSIIVRSLLLVEFCNTIGVIPGVPVSSFSSSEKELPGARFTLGGRKKFLSIASSYEGVL
jgi:hypothetical protein